jgi:methyl-accepting chemotaxis protein
MIKWNVGMKIGIGYAFALVLLVASGALSYRSIKKLEETAGWVGHTHQVLNNMEAVLSGLKDAETGQRGYLLTGNEKYLEPFLSARGAVEEKVKTLRSLTMDNINQQRRLDQLEPLIGEKFSELDETIAVRKDKARGVDAALKIVQTDKGKQSMDDIRKVVTAMMGAEQKLLETRSKEAQASVRNANLLDIYGTLTAIVVLILAAFVIARNISGPLKAIASIAERIAGGDLDGSIAIGGRQDEVGLIARAFSRMTVSLKAMADVAGKIAGGDLDGAIAMGNRGDKDGILGQEFSAMTVSLKTMADVASKIAEGDLRVKVRPLSDKDMLGNAFASMVENLQQLTADIKEGLNVLGSSATEISTSTSQLAASATESASAVSETTTTVEEVRQTTQAASLKAETVKEVAQNASQISQRGKQATDEAVEGMSRIREQMEAIAGSMVGLSERSQDIGQIVASVEDLASQSNLLAVNAAIEAAKAGEQGKGFAVVAQEVKSLAEQSKQATGQVRTILNDIQKATSAAVLATEQGSKAVEAGVLQSAEAGKSIQTLTGSVTQAAQAATQIAASSQQQLIGVDQVASAMESIKQASTQNMDSARQLEGAADGLKTLGQKLKLLIARYQV